MSQLLILLLAALAIEAFAGYPQALYQRFGHPVTWIGALIALLEARANRADDAPEKRRLAGAAALALVLGVTIGIALLLQTILGQAGWLGLAVIALLSSTLIAQRSLYDHVASVATALEQGGLPAGRVAVSQIVGRNPAWLDEHGVARAAIESLAENFADGIVAPAFWLGAGGLAGGAAYKAINTADSMIGHKNDRYLHFGWAAARLDDVVNLPASRLTALWIVMAAAVSPKADARAAARCVWRDAGKHRSPNAGWPEAAMAGALGLKLNGPRVYGETRVDDAYMGEGRTSATSRDIRAALDLYRTACLIQAGTVAIAALLIAI